MKRSLGVSSSRNFTASTLVVCVALAGCGGHTPAVSRADANRICQSIPGLDAFSFTGSVSPSNPREVVCTSGDGEYPTVAFLVGKDGPEQVTPG